MKVFVAHFNAECNEHISHIVNRDDFHFLYGDDCVKAMIKHAMETVVLRNFYTLQHVAWISLQVIL